MSWWQKIVDDILKKYENSDSDNLNQGSNDYYKNTGGNTGPLSTAAGREFAQYQALPDYLKKYFGGENSVAHGEQLSGSTLMEADLQRLLNRMSYSDNVQGMQEAGLNEALMYGGNTDTQQAAQVNPVQPQLAPNQQMMLQLIPSMTQMAQAASQIALNKSRQDNLEAKTDETTLHNNYFRDAYSFRLALEKGNVDIQGYDLLIKEAVKEGMDWDNLFKDASFNFRLTKEEYSARHEEYSAKIAEVDADKQQEFMESLIALYKARKSGVEQDIRESEKRCIKIGKECKILDEDYSWYSRKMFMQYMDVSAAMISATSANLSAYASLGPDRAAVSGTWRQEWGPYAGFSSNWGNTTQKWFPKMYSSQGIEYGGEMQPSVKNDPDSNAFHQPTLEEASDKNRVKYDWVDAYDLHQIKSNFIIRFNKQVYYLDKDGNKRPVFCRKKPPQQFKSRKDQIREVNAMYAPKK